MYLIVDKKTKAPKVAFHSRKQAFRYKAKYGADVVSLMYYGQLCRKKYWREWREKRRQKKFMRLVRKRDRLNRIIEAMRRGH